MSYNFSYSNSVKAPAQMVPCTPELLNAAFDSPQVANACREIAQLLAQVKEGTLAREQFETMKSRLKADHLPVVCFHASFADGYRHNQSAQPSGLSIYDADHLPIEPRTYYFNKVAGREKELGICLAHVSPSGEGIRLVFEMPQGMTLAEAQAWMARQLGDEAYDGCVKDWARCSFVVSRDYLLYYDEEELFKERDNRDKGQRDFCAPADESQETFEETFDGIPYPLIVECIAEQLGTTPALGARNNFIFSVAGHLRYVCNDDPRWIAHVMPRYGEEENKFLSTVRSACNRPQTKAMPKLVERALEMARKRLLVDEKRERANIFSPVPPQMPARLPKFIRTITKNVPPHLQPAVAMAVFPALGAHCYGVKFRYNDNALVEPTFMNVLVAEMSSGKSCVNEPINAIMADIKEADAKNRKIMADYKEAYDTCPATEKKPERPKDVPILWVKADMTPAAFVKLMADAGGRFLYTRMDEIGLLNQLKTNGKGNNVTEILRLAYDCGEYGQERLGTQSVSECVEVRWNWYAATTPGRCRQFFDKSMLDGTLSRITFCTIHSDDDRMPVYGIYDNRFQKLVDPYVKQLREAQGIIICKKANQLVSKMLEENSRLFALADDDVFRELSYRATLSAFKRGMIQYILAGRTWTKEIEDFVRWSFQYDMWCKMWIFGEKMRKAMEKDKAVVMPGRSNLMECLPDTFTSADLDIVRRAQGMHGTSSTLLRKWVQRGYCSLNPATGQYTKSEQFIAKHPKKVA